MIPKIWRVVCGTGLLLLAACAKKEEPVAVTPPAPPKPAAAELVKESERSRHFLAVNSQLELGGTLYAYADVDGDMLKFAGSLQGILGQMAEAQPQMAPFVKQDYRSIFSLLGLDDVKAVGLSSVPDGSGFFRNRVFFYTPEKRRGLLAGLGGPAGPFTHLNLAPADTDLYSEGELDVPAVYASLKQVVAKIGGETTANLVDVGLQKAGADVGISALDLINGLKGRSAMIVRLDPQRNLRWPGPAGVTTPAFSLLLCIDGIGPALEGALTKSPVLAARQEGALKLFELKMPLPLEGIKPVLAIDGSTLFVATSVEFLTEARQQKTGLAQSADFQKALDHVGAVGNALGYVSPALFTRLKQIEALNPQLPADNKQVLRLVMNNLPAPDRPLITLRTNLPEGILIRSYWNRSLKQDVAAVAIYNPVTIGIMAAMAIPAFEKVREASQDKTVLNNLRMLDAAADQYYLEKNTTSAIYDDLVGPDKYVKGVTSVAGEDYSTLIFKQGVPLRVRLKSGKIIQYPLAGQ